MKVLIFILFAVGSVRSLTSSEYQKQFNKNYTGLEKSQRDSYLFVQNSFITPHQTRFKSGRESYNVDFNQITDIGFREKFITSFDALPSDVILPSGKPVVIYKDLIPETFELKLPATDILDQTMNGNWTIMGNCNWGWAFAASKAVEIFLYNNLKVRTTVTLSPQQLIDCLSCENCKRGIPHKAFEYISNYQQNLYPESSYKYTGVKSTCAPKLQYYPSSATIKGFSVLPKISTEEDIKAVLYNSKTPIVFEINPNIEEFMNYKSGVFSNVNYRYFGTHFMVIVGYGSDVDAKGNPVHFWKAINSFGKTWGEDGFIKINRKHPLKNFVFPVGV